MDIRRDMTVTRRKIKVLKTKMDKLLGESLTHLDEEFERFRRRYHKGKGLPVYLSVRFQCAV